MRVLVTGGAGFIGSHVCDALVARGDHVSVIDDLSNGAVENLPKGITLFHRSITEPLDDVFEKIKPDVVVHLAAQVDVRKSLEFAKDDAMINIIGSLNVVEASLRHDVKRIVFASSAGVYGDTTIVPTPEDVPCYPQNPYAIGKLAIEHYLASFLHTRGVRTCVLRFANVYGPRQGSRGEGGVVSVFVRKLIAGEQPLIYGDGSQTRDLVYVRDVAQAVLVAVDSDLTGSFNVSTQTQVSVNDLFRAVAKELDYPWTPKHGPAFEGEIKHSCLKADKIRPHWHAKTPLSEGLHETVAWFKSHAIQSTKA